MEISVTKLALVYQMLIHGVQTHLIRNPTAQHNVMSTANISYAQIGTAGKCSLLRVRCEPLAR